MLQSMGLQRVGYDLMTEQQWRRLKDRGNGAGCRVSSGGTTEGGRAKGGAACALAPFTHEDAEAEEAVTCQRHRTQPLGPPTSRGDCHWGLGPAPVP